MTRRFTTADLENLTEGATPGPWRWYWDQGIMSLEGADNAPVATDLDVRDSDLLAAAPELAAEHHRIITAIEDRIRTLRAPLCSHMPEGDQMDEYVEQWERQQYEISVLTNILNGETHE